jgi:hypothetical protein
MPKRSRTGSVAANLHEGSRSEVLADYLFSGWGTVTPVRRQSDYGIDLYCTLLERLGRRAVVTDYFVVQVKSEMEPWGIHGKKSVQWLVEHPTPIFLAFIDKKNGILRVYHVTPRFYVWATGQISDRLELRPEDREDGEFIKWENGTTFSLSAPILRVTIADLLDEARMRLLRDVFATWVRLDRENCDLVRQGLFRFRMPNSYRVNQMPSQSIVELGNAVPERTTLKRGILTLAESVQCIGGQLGQIGDRSGALLAALLLDHLQIHYPDMFHDSVRWQSRIPGQLGHIVCSGLNQVMPTDQTIQYYYQGLEAVEAILANDPLVKRYLTAFEAAQHGHAQKRP